MNKSNLVDQFVNEFENFKILLHEHIEFNNEVLPHVFFGECNDFIMNYLTEDEEKDILEDLFSFYERMATEGDDYVRELLAVTILERIGDDNKILNTAYGYMGQETRKLSDEIEKFLGRY
jgi:hypothetical protein